MLPTPATGWGALTPRAGAWPSSYVPRSSFGSRIEQDRRGNGHQVQKLWLFSNHREGDGTEKHSWKYRSRIGSTTD